MFSVVLSTAAAVAALLLGWEWESYEQRVFAPQSYPNKWEDAFVDCSSNLWSLLFLEFLQSKQDDPQRDAVGQCEFCWLKYAVYAVRKAWALYSSTPVRACVQSFLTQIPSPINGQPLLSLAALLQAITPAVTGETLGLSEWPVCLGWCEQAATWARAGRLI